MRACVHTLGCKVNQVESFALMRRLEELGYETTEDLDADCELYLLNTCAVTNEGERKSRQIFRRIRRNHPGAKVVVCGCASQKNPEDFAEEGVLVSGTMDKYGLPDRLGESGISLREQTEFDDRCCPKQVRTRAYIKVQDGCNNYCSYCIVPYLRGRSRSRSIESIRREIAENAQAQEFVLTGINLSDYGRGIGSSLAELLGSLADLDARIRLGSLEVGAVTPEFLDAAKALKKFCPQFHLSLQSGSDRVLKDMNRRYTREEYLARCRLIREAFPEAALTTDVIVGFPTETEMDFLETLDLCARAKFFEMHVFPYSRREGTRAEKWKPLPRDVINARLRALTGLGVRLKHEFLDGMLGQRTEVLTECEEEGRMTGHTRNYVKVYADAAPPGALVNMKLVSLCGEGMYGEKEE